jgi:SAM-dependent methyltransferase
MSFYTNIIHYYDQLFPLDLKKLEFVLDTTSPQKILDIGCATGALCHELHHKGHHVVGIDIDKAIIDKARGKGSDGPQFVPLDMLTLDRNFESEEFDQILCFDNTLAHLPNEMAVRRFFTVMAKILKPDGVFKCEVVNYDQALAKGMLDLPIIEVDGLVLKRHQCLEQQYMECYTELANGDETTKNCIPLFPIRYEQIETLLKEVGFTQFKLYQDFQRNAPTDDHIYNIIEVRR